MRDLRYFAFGFIVSLGLVGQTVQTFAAPEQIGPPRERPKPAEVTDGIYSFSGEGPAGEYGGAGTIARVGKNYILRTTHGGLGLGLLRGDKLSVAWKGGIVTVFHIQGDLLSGEWANGDGEYYHEHWELLKKKNE